LKYGVVVAMVVVHVAAWLITTDQKAAHTLNADWQLLPGKVFAFAQAAQDAVHNLVVEHADSLVG
jgi:steroid 5-alpha reductase family enzyme